MSLYFSSHAGWSSQVFGSGIVQIRRVQTDREGIQLQPKGDKQSNSEEFGTDKRVKIKWPEIPVDNPGSNQRCPGSDEIQSRSGYFIREHSKR